MKKTGVKDKRLLITKNSILMLVALVVIFLAVYAWYHVNRRVSAKGITVAASNPEVLKIAVDNDGEMGSWVNNSWSAGTFSPTANFAGPFRFTTDVTGNGEVFIIPVFNSNEKNESAEAEARRDGKIVNADGIPKDALSNLDYTDEEISDGAKPDYYSVPFYLQSKTSHIVLKANAYLAMAAEVEGDTFSGPASVRKSAYGNFSADALVAAMRVSITGAPIASISNNRATVTAQNRCNLIWNPRPDLFLNLPDSTSENNWTLIQNVTPETSLSRAVGSGAGGILNFTGKTYENNYYEKRFDGNTLNGVNYVQDSSTGNHGKLYKSSTSQTATVRQGVTVPTLGTSVSLTEGMAEPSKIGDYYYYKFYLNVWIEGTDTEARRAMDTGEFSMFLEFSNV